MQPRRAALSLPSGFRAGCFRWREKSFPPPAKRGAAVSCELRFYGAANVQRHRQAGLLFPVHVLLLYSKQIRLLHLLCSRCGAREFDLP